MRGKKRVWTLLIVIGLALGLAWTTLAAAGAQASLPFEPARPGLHTVWPRTTGPAAPALDCGDDVPVTVYFSDLEADDGGWVVTHTQPITGGWEWGTIVTGVQELCGIGVDPGPMGGHSGARVWATNLDGCYPNFDGTTSLHRTFDFSALQAPVELAWWDWYHINGSFDHGQVVVNGDVLRDFPLSDEQADWTGRTLDLSAYAGESQVRVAYDLIASTVVNRMGWYLDDLAVRTCAPAEPSIAFTKTVGTDPALCAETRAIGLPSGGGLVTYCYRASNTGNISFTLHDLADSELGAILSTFPYTLSPGAEVWLTQTVEITQPVVNTAAWTAYNPGPANVVSATSAATVTISTNPSIAFTKTVGTDPGVCAVSEALVLPPGGGEATYCYRVTNDGDAAFALHDLIDSELGVLLDGFAYDLPPGASVWVTQTAVLTRTTVNTATWAVYNPGLGSPSALAEDTATVWVEARAYLPVVFRNAGE